MTVYRTMAKPGVLLVLCFALAVSVTYVYSCNQAVCASIVSKCMLTQSCKCELRNCTCCKECFTCLDYLYTECCSCVEMCPKPNDTASELSKKSHVEELSENEAIPDLFKALTEERDAINRWVTFTFPVDLNLSIFRPKLDKEIKYKTIDAEQEVIPLKDLITVNCTVAYMSQCMSWQKCRKSCSAMGASSYRWFHDGCCECVGSTCINYGINESRCLLCPLPDDEDDDLPIEPEGFVDYDFESDNLTEKEEKESKEKLQKDKPQNLPEEKKDVTAE